MIDDEERKDFSRTVVLDSSDDRAVVLRDGGSVCMVRFPLRSQSEQLAILAREICSNGGDVRAAAKSVNVSYQWACSMSRKYKLNPFGHGVIFSVKACMDSGLGIRETADRLGITREKAWLIAGAIDAVVESLGAGLDGPVCGSESDGGR